MEGISNSVLLQIAKEIGNNVEKLPVLGNKLGFNPAEVQNFMMSNRVNFTSNGTQRMLIDWSQRVTRGQQRDELRSALHAADLGAIADTYLGTGKACLHHW